MMASHSLSGDRSVEPIAPKMRCWRSSASRHRPPSTASSRRPRSAPRWARRDWRIWRYTAAASSGRPSRRASWARRRNSVVAASSTTVVAGAPKLRRLRSVMPRSRSERRGMGSFTDAMTRVARSGGARPNRARLARGHPLLFLDHPLAVDTVARERQSLEPLLGDRLAAPLARAERAVVQLLQGRDDIAQQPAVAVAQLEEEFSRVRSVRLVAEVLDGIVFLVFSVQGGSPDLFGQLALLLDEPLFEVSEPVLPHLDLLPHDQGACSRNRR